MRRMGGDRSSAVRALLDRPPMTMRKILLTGATGFIGGELLRRLLRRDARSIVCLVRAESDEDAQARGASTLAALLGRSVPRLAARITWVRGDVERPRLGLDDATWESL